MAKFLWKASYTSEGVKGVLKEGGTGRRAVVEKAVEALGGKLESLYFALGEHDLYAIADLPDTVAATAVSLTVNASGMVALQTVELLTPEQVDEASKKSVEYRPPGA
ncbi:MAG: GYD domain-containing protein [Solirubrobacterales bacterium]|nr:GYD domain-containing protein [Solirubrobacterales bacterium]MBV8947069.1 GYD domain-containing protein [Solirubrobacterales bacterium]MBV9362844.1 GYD domain-containing protein [Solirubrobacterales bacterium]MBV9683589.1 GYD domain-containing protein [Solirubrobacterales bacterium]MBV9805903.1 GYD domain-containing protein [Solirubrobacterales bacterium]